MIKKIPETLLIALLIINGIYSSQKYSKSWNDLSLKYILSCYKLKSFWQKINLNRNKIKLLSNIHGATKNDIIFEIQ